MANSESRLSFLSLAVSLLFLPFFTLPTFAQYSGNVQGVVSGSAGAAVNGASVGPVDPNMGDPGFGKVGTVLPARQLQLGLRVAF